MKILALLCLALMPLCLNAQQKPEPDFYDTAFVKKQKIRSVKVFAGGELQEAYDFNRLGKIIKEFPEPEKTAGRRPEDSIAYTRDPHHPGRRILRQSYYKNGALSYADSFVYDERGNVTRLFRIGQDGQATVHKATTYDSRNNPIEDISYGQEYGVNRLVRTYDAAGRLVLLTQYQWLSQPYHLDSSVYDAKGRIAEHYSFSFTDEKPVLEERYFWTYDAAGNLVSVIKMKTDAQIWEHENYKYNGKKQLTEQTSYNRFQTINPYKYVTYRYDKSGLLIERKTYYSNKDFIRTALPKPNVMKWVYVRY